MIRSSFKIYSLLLLFFATGSVQASDVLRCVVLPNELFANTFSVDENLRLAGLVSSIEKEGNGAGILLDVTDGHTTIQVKYAGILPDLLTTGEPALFTGTLQNDVFVTTEILVISPSGCEHYLPPVFRAELVSLGFYECGQPGSYLHARNLDGWKFCRN